MVKQSVNILEVIGSRSIKEKNISAVELNQLKQNSKRAKLKETDPEKAETVRLENNKRKAAQRKSN